MEILISALVAHLSFFYQGRNYNKMDFYTDILRVPILHINVYKSMMFQSKFVVN